VFLLGFFADSSIADALDYEVALFGGYVGAKFYKMDLVAINGWGVFWGYVVRVIIAFVTILYWITIRGNLRKATLLYDPFPCPCHVFFSYYFWTLYCGSFWEPILAQATIRKFKFFLQNVKTMGLWNPNI